MAAPAPPRWIFSQEQIDKNTPSRQLGMDKDTEYNWRYQAGNLIQEIGQKLTVTQLCINTAIVYQHRFYMCHPIQKFPIQTLCPACVFLAAKVEEQPRKLEHVTKTAYACIHRDRDQTKFHEEVSSLSQDIVCLENILLQTLGFVTTVDHPHTQIVNTCGMVKAARELSHSSYLFATTSLLVTTMCLQYSTGIVACVCINVACRWSSFEIPLSSEGKHWYSYVDSALSTDLLEALTKEFCDAINKYPNKLSKKKPLHQRVPTGEAVPGHQRSKTEFASTAVTQDMTDGREKTQPSTSIPAQKQSTITGQPWSGRAASTTGAAAASELLSPAKTSEMAKRPAGDTAMVRPSVSGEQGRNANLVSVEQAKQPAGEQSARQPLPQGALISDVQLRRVRTESCLNQTTLSPQQYLDRKERERLERERLEHESSKLHGTGGKPAGPNPAVKLDQRNMNIFEKIKPESISLSEERTDLAKFRLEGQAKVEGQVNVEAQARVEPKVEVKVSAEELDLDQILKPEHIHGAADMRFPIEHLGNVPSHRPGRDNGSTIRSFDQKPQEHNHHGRGGHRARGAAAAGAPGQVAVDAFPPAAQNNHNRQKSRHNPNDMKLTNNNTSLVDSVRVHQPTVDIIPVTVPATHQVAPYSKEEIQQKHHKRDRPRHHSRTNEPSVPLLGAQQASTLLNAEPADPSHPALQPPLKLKIPNPYSSASHLSSVPSSEPRRRIRSPVFENRAPLVEYLTETPTAEEKEGGIKIKLLKGSSGHVERVEVPDPSLSRKLPSSPPPPPSPPRKLVITKNKDGKYVNHHHHGGQGHRGEHHSSSRSEEKEKHRRKRQPSESSSYRTNSAKIPHMDQFGNGHQVTNAGDPSVSEAHNHQLHIQQQQQRLWYQSQVNNAPQGKALKQRASPPPPPPPPPPNVSFPPRPPFPPSH